MPDSNNRPDITQLWRNWLTDTEHQWNAFFNDVMGTDSFGRFLGGYMEIYGTLPLPRRRIYGPRRYR
jgi:hypothetical protein